VAVNRGGDAKICIPFNGNAFSQDFYQRPLLSPGATLGLTCLKPQDGSVLSLLTQINSGGLGPPRIGSMEFRLDYAAKARPMFDASELRDELQTLKGEVSRLLNTTSEGIFDTSKNRAEALADQIKSALNDLSETLGEQEEHLEDIVSERPITSLASAFALGVVVGFMLRRH
jgi:ElaB/YqjD/DUF883 family membrane-anchored ribosome-binding protein